MDEKESLKFICDAVYDYFSEFKKFALEYSLDEISGLMNTTYRLEGIVCGLFGIDPMEFIKYYDKYPDKDECIDTFIKEQLLNE